ncbi:SAP domain-containing protein [Encephalitozoon hellem]|uniref:SAP domain-containing protein n=3 Tax=Encephalitozoon hellem TaxID=27973 RepID=A0ABY8CNQ7_ENCHE|nr:SAP domain-containing protein [Encephalitozoon hellem]
MMDRKGDRMEDDHNGKPIEIPSRGRPRKRDVESFLHLTQSQNDFGNKSKYGHHQFINQGDQASLSEFQRLQNSISSEYHQRDIANGSPNSLTSFLEFNRPFSRTKDFSSNEVCSTGIGPSGVQNVQGIETYGSNELGHIEDIAGSPIDKDSSYSNRRSAGEQNVTKRPSFLQEFKTEACSPQDGNFSEMSRRLFREDMFSSPAQPGPHASWGFQQDFTKAKEDYDRHESLKKSIQEGRPHEDSTHTLYPEGQGIEELNQRFRNGHFQMRMGVDPYYEGSPGNERHSFYERRASPYAPNEISRIHIPEGHRSYPYAGGGFPSSQMFIDREFNQEQASHVNNQKVPGNTEGIDYDRRMMASLFPGGPTFRTHFQQRYMDTPAQGNIWMNRKKRKSNPLLWQYIKSNQGIHPGIVHPSKYSSLDFIQGVDDSQKMYLGAMRKSPPERSNGNSIFPLFLNSNKGVTDEFKEVVQNFRNSINELDFNNVTVQQLKSLMKEFGLNHTGKKNELIERLRDILKKIDGKEVHKPEEQIQEKTKEADDFEFYFF